MSTEKYLAKRFWKHKAWLSFELLLVLSTVLSAQQDTLRITHTFLETVQQLAVDKLQHVYLSNAQNDLVKYNASGQLVYQFNNNTKGALRTIDATDPFNVLLFYPDFQQLILLDRTLNEKARFSLYDSGIGEASAVALSNDNRIWVFDRVSFQLMKIDYDGQVVLNSEDLSFQLGQGLELVQLQAREDLLFALDKNRGLFLFDNFGQFHKHLPLSDVISFQVLENNLLLLQKTSGLYLFNRLSFQQTALLLPTAIKLGEIRQAFYQSGYWYVLLEKGQALILR
ncbi:MAG TPA: hypothetical protein PKA00_19305 [Saprospiraceae bacterium]|nr:hypothetical protein [Saprospiraceae bacterium]HMQ85066.1 hypothetical protein [Saprospiraceae bacterium]